MKKELIRRIGIGFILGIVICYLLSITISIFLGNGNYYPCLPSLTKRFGNEITAVIIQTILSAILGSSLFASSLIWEKENWSLLKQTSLYFAIVTILMMTVAYLCDWMEHSVKGVLCYFAMFFVIFIIIWTIQFTFLKHLVKKINSEIICRDEKK